MKKIIRLTEIISIIAVIFANSPAPADVYIESSPENWQLQNYMGGNIIVYFAGSPCTNGLLTFPSAATSDDKNRFWSLILTAKSTGKSVGLGYETTSGSCNITSFGLREEITF